MRIGICGAESTGKTTLAKALAEQLGLPLITERAREVAKGFGIENMDLEYPKSVWEAFQWECLWSQMQAEDEHQQFVSDRTVLDNLAYWLADRGSERGRGSVDTVAYISRVRTRLKEEPYDLLIFARPEGVPMEDDGFRHYRDKFHRDLVDLMLSMLLPWAWDSAPDMRVLHVSGDAERRLKAAIGAVDMLLTEDVEIVVAEGEVD